MKKIDIHTVCKKLLADVHTPVGIYLRLRDRFRDTILLESTDHHAAENSWSFIGINAIGGIEIKSAESMEIKFPGRPAEKIAIDASTNVPGLLWNYMQRFDVQKSEVKEAKYAQGLFGYTSYDAVKFFDNVKLPTPDADASVGIPTGFAASGLPTLPLIRYRLYQYVIAINHFRDELFICENQVNGLESEKEIIESLIRSKDVPVYPFCATNEESSNMKDEEYIEMVKAGIHHCHRGDVFQVVLSRRFQQSFKGDEFNVYRALRNINPSPYLFFF